MFNRADLTAVAPKAFGAEVGSACPLYSGVAPTGLYAQADDTRALAIALRTTRSTINALRLL